MRTLTLRKYQILFLTIICVSIAYAKTYEVTVTRKDSNWYSVDRKDVAIKTKYCYEYAYSELAFLNTGGYKDELTFSKSGKSCSVDAIYGEVKYRSGNYAIKVTRQDDNWYEISGTQTFIKTNYCLSLALMKDAILSIGTFGSGTLLVDNYKCAIDGFYSEIRL
jgi:hypothetical protein